MTMQSLPRATALRLLAIASVLLGVLLALLGTIATVGMIGSLFSDHHPLTMSIGSVGITTVSSSGKLIAFALALIFLITSYLFSVTIPNKIRSRQFHAHREN